MRSKFETLALGGIMLDRFTLLTLRGSCAVGPRGLEGTDTSGHDAEGWVGGRGAEPKGLEGEEGRSHGHGCDIVCGGGDSGGDGDGNVDDVD